MVKFLGFLVAAGLLYRVFSGQTKRGNRRKTFSLAAGRQAYDGEHLSEATPARARERREPAARTFTDIPGSQPTG